MQALGPIVEPTTMFNIKDKAPNVKPFPEVIPGLKGVKGGDKEKIINQNLDVIAILNDRHGFDVACKVFSSYPKTIIRALDRYNGNHRPAITKRDLALSRTLDNETKVFALIEQVIKDRKVRDKSKERFLVALDIVERVVLPVMRSALEDNQELELSLRGKSSKSKPKFRSRLGQDKLCKPEYKSSATPLFSWN